MKRNLLRVAKSIYAIGIVILSSAGYSYAQLPDCYGPLGGSIRVCGPQLVQNGDFENGYTNFSTEFNKLGTTNPSTGRAWKVGDCQIYTLTKNAGTVHPKPNEWCLNVDHTYPSSPGTGTFFLGDAQCNAAVKRAWYQNVNVLQGKTYYFEAYGADIDCRSYSNVIVFIIKDQTGVPITTSAPIRYQGGSGSRWTKVCGYYTAPQTGSIELQVNVTPSVPSNGLLGADFALDDIKFQMISPGDPDFTFIRKTKCENEFVTFKATTVVGVHSWDFGSPDAVPTTGSGAVAHTVYTKPGTYTVRHTLTSPTSTCEEVKTYTITVDDCNSIVGCNNQLDECGANLISNGDFEGTAIIGSDLVNTGTGAFGACTGFYKLANSSVPYSGTDNKRSSWTTSKDHTSGTGKFMVGDPPCTSDGVVVWRQSVNVVQGATYNFSAWVSNLCPTNNTPQMVLRVEGNLVTAPTAIAYETDATRRWKKVCGSFVATTTGLIKLEVEVGPSADAAIAADFGLDDVSLYRLGKVTAEFTVPSARICAGSTVSFTSAQAGSVNHSWNFGSPNASPTTSTVANPNVTFNKAGIFNVVHTVNDPSTGCANTVSKPTTIENCCSVTSTFTATPVENATDCSMNFSDQSTYSVETGAIDNWLWTVHDQNGTTTTYTTQNVSHNFSGSGPHQVCLKVTGSTGDETCTSETCLEVNVPCDLNVCVIDARFTWEKPAAMQTPGSVTLLFHNESTYQGATTESNANLVWYFPTSTSQYEIGSPEPIRSFTTANGEGQAPVVLTVTSRNGDLTCTDNYCQIIDLKTLTATSCRYNPNTGTIIRDLGKAGSNALGVRESSMKMYPNPFSTALNIEVLVESEGRLRIEVLDMNGKKIETLIDENRPTGTQVVSWTPDEKLTNGLYVIHVQQQSGAEHYKVNMIR